MQILQDVANLSGIARPNLEKNLLFGKVTEKFKGYKISWTILYIHVHVYIEGAQKNWPPLKQLHNYAILRLL